MSGADGARSLRCTVLTVSGVRALAGRVVRTVGAVGPSGEVPEQLRLCSVCGWQYLKTAGGGLGRRVIEGAMGHVGGTII